METLFFLIVLAVIIISNVVNIRKKLKQSESGSDEKAGWRKSLKDMIAEIKTEMEKASGGEPASRPRRPSGWDELLGRGMGEPAEKIEEPRPEKQKSGPRTLMETKAPPLMETKAPPRMETKAPPKMETARETLLESRRKTGETPEARMEAKKKETAESKPAAYYPKLPEMPEAPVARPRVRQGSAYSVAELQNAVIWYEILSPPVALREPDREMWQ